MLITTGHPVGINYYNKTLLLRAQNGQLTEKVANKVRYT